jgi:hypothetical protein
MADGLGDVAERASHHGMRLYPSMRGATSSPEPFRDALTLDTLTEIPRHASPRVSSARRHLLAHRGPRPLRRMAARQDRSGRSPAARAAKGLRPPRINPERTTGHQQPRAPWGQDRARA